MVDLAASPTASRKCRSPSVSIRFVQRCAAAHDGGALLPDYGAVGMERANVDISGVPGSYEVSLGAFLESFPRRTRCRVSIRGRGEERRLWADQVLVSTLARRRGGGLAGASTHQGPNSKRCDDFRLLEPGLHCSLSTGPLAWSVVPIAP